MPATMAHERMRWETMTERELERRLSKITTMEKLYNFREMACQYNNQRLIGLANARIGELARLLNTHARYNEVREVADPRDSIALLEAARKAEEKERAEARRRRVRMIRIGDGWEDKDG